MIITRGAVIEGREWERAFQPPVEADGSHHDNKETGTPAAGNKCNCVSVLELELQDLLVRSLPNKGLLIKNFANPSPSILSLLHRRQHQFTARV
jgi:hypothetical protein